MILTMQLVKLYQIMLSLLDYVWIPKHLISVVSLNALNSLLKLFALGRLCVTH